MQKIKIEIGGVIKEFKECNSYKREAGDFELFGTWYGNIETEDEVNTKVKNYKILTFRHTKNPNVFYRLRFGDYVCSHNGFSYSLNEMFKYVKEGGIEVYKVKRLFDNYVITVGDANEFGKITKIDMMGEKDCMVRHTEVKPPVDHQIISFKDTSGQSWIVSKNGEYNSTKFPLTSYTLDNLLLYVKSGIVQIETVSRLSDHQVFTVGNGMNYNKNGTCYVIENFILRDGKIYINGHETDKTIEDWILYVEPPVILTTEDGVKITDGEQLLYGVNERWDKWDSYAHIASVKTIKYFSTPEARDEYILLNKPVLVTFKEMLKHHHDCMGKRFTNIEDGIEVFFKLKHELIKPEFPTDHIG